MFLEQNSIVGNYRVISLLGKGGMGEVYLAEDEFLNRKVALKVLNPQLTTDSQFVERFKQEARVQANLIHSNIVSLYSFLIHQEKYIMVMQYAPGITLKELINKTGAVPEERAMKVFCQIISGVNYAHSQGIIHRDIKPSNVIIDDNDIVKIMDFGIAKIVGDAGLTRTGAKMGTLYYMSPEQVKAQKDIDHRTDIYSLGVTLFEVLSGRVPFDTDTDSDYDIMDKIVKDDLPDPRIYYPHISQEYVNLISVMTAKERNDRMYSLAGIAREFHSGADSISNVAVESKVLISNTSYCKKCGAKNNQNAQRCVSCGKLMKSSVADIAREFHSGADSISNVAVESKVLISNTSYCKKCGAKNNQNAQRCVSCGKLMKSSVDSGPTFGLIKNNPKNYGIKSHLMQAILVTLFCCLPFGVISIVFAASVAGKIRRGDIEGAIKASNKANAWANWAFGIGIFMALFYFIAVLSSY